MARVKILVGDNRRLLKTLRRESVNCIVTSPPYFGLRDYGTATWEGGDPRCDHKGVPFRTKANLNRNYDGGRDIKNAEDREFFKKNCGKCGAKRVDLQIGLEATPEEYVAALVDVFREARRVLRKDGTLWLNLGDSYNGAGRVGHGARTGYKQGSNRASAHGVDFNRPNAPALKPKDLCGVPWRVAFALQADGWYLRQDIIWSKPNAMPESVTDRCTKAHEYIFLLSKSDRYHFDAEEIAERSIAPGVRLATPYTLMSVGTTTTTPYNGNAKETRNKRSVWSVPTHPYSDAHFATFPPALIEPCILAGCPKGGTVLDPFSGAGTTGMVAERTGRNAVLLELNRNYAEMARTRIRDDAGWLVAAGASALELIDRS